MSRVLVPELIGLTMTQAHDCALDAGVLAVDVATSHTASSVGHVHDQRPRPGRQVRPGARIHIWVRINNDGDDGPDDGDDGGGGLRVPLGPRPLLSGHK